MRTGIYLLDEPEAALSLTGTLALLAIVARAASSGAQFIIATHSPVLLATPAAQLYELDEDGVSSPVYDDLQAVRQMRGFLEAPEPVPAPDRGWVRRGLSAEAAEAPPDRADGPRPALAQ